MIRLALTLGCLLLGTTVSLIGCGPQEITEEMARSKEQEMIDAERKLTGEEPRRN